MFETWKFPTQVQSLLRYNIKGILIFITNLVSYQSLLQVIDFVSHFINNFSVFKSFSLFAAFKNFLILNLKGILTVLEQNVCSFYVLYCSPVDGIKPWMALNLEWKIDQGGFIDWMSFLTTILMEEISPNPEVISANTQTSFIIRME